MVRPVLGALALQACAMSSPIAWAQAAPANTIKEMFAAVTKCWRAPPGTEGMQLTVRMSLTRDGTMLGKPAITHSSLGKDEKLNAEFVGSVLQSLQTCVPVAITPALGGALAGRPFTILFSQRGRQA